MSNENVTSENKELALNQSDIISEEKLLCYLETFTGQNALLENEKKSFIQIASAFNLNPWKKEVYCLAYGEGKYRKLSIIVGYEVYLKRAECSGKLGGWRVWTEGKVSNGSLVAKIEIHRKDWSMPLIHEVYFTEYNQDNKIWKSKPVTMIKKVAMAQGFRLAFPEDLGGIPYTSDELPDNMTQAETLVTKPIPEVQSVFEKAQDVVERISDNEEYEKCKDWIGKKFEEKKLSNDEIDELTFQMTLKTEEIGKNDANKT